MRSTTEEPSARAWAAQLAAEADLLAEHVALLDQKFGQRLALTGLRELEDLLPDLRRRLNDLVAVLALHYSPSDVAEYLPSSRCYEDRGRRGIARWPTPRIT